MVVKAELHCHIEGAASPELVIRQADKYGGNISPYIKGDSFVWHDFTSFLAAYDASSALFRSEEDYALLAETYLTELAGYDAIYSEIFVSPDHARSAGLSPKTYIDALAEGMKRAHMATGIESRMIVIGVRHFGREAVEAAANFAVKCGNPLVTGFGMAGEERFGDPADYVHAFDIAREAGFGITVHAGELAGWESVAAALDNFHPSRIGHGVRAIENPDLVRRIADEAIVLECCPGSNIALKVFPTYRMHPFPALLEAGCKVTLNSDDPPYFWTSLQREYDIARNEFGMDDRALVAVTRTALEAAFVDEETRKRLLGLLLEEPVAYKSVTP
jgi:adenosine deaminase